MTRQPRAGKAAAIPPDAVTAHRDIRLPMGDDRLFVGSVAKSFRILELLSESGRALTLMELAERSGLGKSATQRAAHTLRVLGYLSQHPETRAYSLSYRMLELTHTVLAEDRVRMVSMPLLEALNNSCGETVNLTRLAGTEVVFIARFPSRHSVSVDPRNRRSATSPSARRCSTAAAGSSGQSTSPLRRLGCRSLGCSSTMVPT